MTKDCTHLVAKTTSGAKFEYASLWELEIVSVEWIADSVKSKICRDEREYKVVDERYNILRGSSKDNNAYVAETAKENTERKPRKVDSIRKERALRSHSTSKSESRGFKLHNFKRNMSSNIEEYSELKPFNDVVVYLSFSGFDDTKILKWRVNIYEMGGEISDLDKFDGKYIHLEKQIVVVFGKSDEISSRKLKMIAETFGEIKVVRESWLAECIETQRYAEEEIHEVHIKDEHVQGLEDVDVDVNVDVGVDVDGVNGVELQFKDDSRERSRDNEADSWKCADNLNGNPQMSIKRESENLNTKLNTNPLSPTALDLPKTLKKEKSKRPFRTNGILEIREKSAKKIKLEIEEPTAEDLRENMGELFRGIMFVSIGWTGNKEDLIRELIEKQSGVLVNIRQLIVRICGEKGVKIATKSEIELLNQELASFVDKAVLKYGTRVVCVISPLKGFANYEQMRKSWETRMDNTQLHQQQFYWVTECWLERSIDDQKLYPFPQQMIFAGEKRCDTREKHLPVRVLFTPLTVLQKEALKSKKWRFSVSGYEGVERHHIGRLCEYLQVDYSETFSKKTTHLICKPPFTGPKYERGLKWGTLVMSADAFYQLVIDSSPSVAEEKISTKTPIKTEQDLPMKLSSTGKICKIDLRSNTLEERKYNMLCDDQQKPEETPTKILEQKVSPMVPSRCVKPEHAAPLIESGGVVVINDENMHAQLLEREPLKNAFHTPLMDPLVKKTEKSYGLTTGNANEKMQTDLGSSLLKRKSLTKSEIRPSSTSATKLKSPPSIGHQNTIMGSLMFGTPGLTPLAESLDKNIDAAFGNARKGFQVFKPPSEKLKGTIDQEMESLVTPTKPVNNQSAMDILKGVVITVSTRLQSSQQNLETLARSLGAQTISVNEAINNLSLNTKGLPLATHLIHQSTKQQDYLREVRWAKKNNLFIVSPFWLYSCNKYRFRVDENLFGSQYGTEKLMLVESRNAVNNNNSGGDGGDTSNSTNRNNNGEVKPFATRDQPTTLNDQSSILELDILDYYIKNSEPPTANNNNSNQNTKNAETLYDDTNGECSDAILANIGNRADSRKSALSHPFPTSDSISKTPKNKKQTSSTSMTSNSSTDYKKNYILVEDEEGNQVRERLLNSYK
ncbi:hypothetical protein AX774_g546 [Zancudomyces culisetae]|uniref:BRCT domain-containing protein n=1 Tax=Zancudomyces culisetae TaxID=1213189 RepID=A0A1R1PY59_ZANCU|nr:hypothetical protein AX774_g546 [Zancudomyces culisetae]|eukprot:OMH85901.1 hypothetical protein AX774_g546 [Zancudomyces culisetae]